MDMDQLASTVVSLILLLAYAKAMSPEPEFAETIRNVTVPLGREAVLSCIINNLADHKVGWLRADDQTILSLNKKVVTHNPRVTVQHESRTWNLHIRQIRESDRGCYMCQINTAQMKKQLGCIEVQVPPDIMDESSTSDVTIKEGDNVTLMCRATGKPTPRIIWRREDGQRIVLHKSPLGASHQAKARHESANSAVQSLEPSVSELYGNSQVHGRDRLKEVEMYHGEVLKLYRVTRRMMGAYMCIASNDVPPAVSKRVSLNVNFAPVVQAETQLMVAPIGSEIQLRCQIESHPPSIHFWMKGRPDDNTILLDSKKVSMTEERTGYRSTTTLTIRHFDSLDQDTYTCVATNSMGSAEASVCLYEMQRETPKPSSINSNPITTVAMTTAIKTSTADKGVTRTTSLKPRFHATTSPPPSITMRQSSASAFHLHLLLLGCCYCCCWPRWFY